MATEQYCHHRDWGSIFVHFPGIFFFLSPLPWATHVSLATEFQVERWYFFFASSLTLLNFNQIRVLKTHSPFSYSNKHIVNIANDPDGSRPFLSSALSFFWHGMVNSWHNHTSVHASHIFFLNVEKWEEEKEPISILGPHRWLLNSFTCARIDHITWFWSVSLATPAEGRLLLVPGNCCCYLPHTFQSKCCWWHTLMLCMLIVDVLNVWEGRLLLNGSKLMKCKDSRKTEWKWDHITMIAFTYLVSWLQEWKKTLKYAMGSKCIHFDIIF